MGYDELAPVSLKGKNSFGNLGAMVIDSLDTLWMFGLREEFQLYVLHLCLWTGHLMSAIQNNSLWLQNELHHQSFNQSPAIIREDSQRMHPVKSSF